MRPRPLPRTDLPFPPIGLGGAGLGNVYGPVTDGQVAAIVTRALDLGVSFIDTAPLYGPSEERLGLALAGRREEVILATKCGLHRGGGRELTFDGILRGVEASLQRLRTDRLDVLQYHEIQPEIAGQVLSADGPLGAMRRLRDEGVVRLLGVTGRDLETLCLAVRTGAFDTVLTYMEYSPLTLAAQRTLFPVAAEHGVAVIAGSPLHGGLLSGDPARLDGRHDPAVAERARRFHALAAEAGWSVPELALAFELADPRVATVIPGFTSVAEVESAVRAAERGVPGELIAAIIRIATS
ncbi:MAG: aldo/keto reductase [Armatimonadetes bacterium]|nr:aldo/keto reductase [Armatimonadota bacterium]